jgi:hypothetical protein
MASGACDFLHSKSKIENSQSNPIFAHLIYKEHEVVERSY